MGFLPPIGLEYIASSIEDIVEKVVIIDLRYEKEPLSSFITKDTDLVLISYNWGIEEAFIKNSINNIPDNITIVVGGRYATENVDELFEKIPRINGIARGDGEDIAREIIQKGLASGIDGLSFQENGRIVHNKNRILNPVPKGFYPNRNLRRYKYMVTIDEYNSGIQIDLMLGSRGCPHNCKFCDFKFNPLGEKRRWSSRTPESVVEELKTVEAGVVGFADDIFTANMDWIDRLCDLIMAEGIKKKYAINARLEIAKRPEVLEKMYRAGFMVFLMGIESAHDKTLASMNKGFTVAKVREYFEVLKKFDFIYHCYFIIGNIGESKKEMMDIVDFSHELGVDTLGLSVLRATKYSPLKDMLKDFKTYHIETESGKVYSDALSAGDIQQIRRDINASFFNTAVILRLLKKMILHKLLTVGRVYKILVFTVRRKIKKRARKRSITR